LRAYSIRPRAAAQVRYDARVKREERTERIALRLTPSELALYQRAAEHADEDVSTIVRRGATIEARGIVARVEGEAGRKVRGRAKEGKAAGAKAKGRK